MTFNFELRQIATASMVLFAVIDILGSIPIIIGLRKKVGHIQSEKASVGDSEIFAANFPRKRSQRVYIKGHIPNVVVVVKSKFRARVSQIHEPSRREVQLSGPTLIA